jgi:teichuronic acid biosynthesis glycosyltransferase TuaC
MTEHVAIRVLMVSSLWPSAERPDVAPFLQQHVESLRAQGVDVDVIAPPIERRLSRIPSARRAVRTRLRSAPYDIVHVQFGWSALLVGRTRVPMVITFHGSDLEGVVGPGGTYTFTGRILARVGRAAARRARAVIVVSQRLARRLPPETRYHVIPMGVNLEVFTPASQREARGELGLPADRRLVLFGGSPDRPEKRYALAQDAVAQLPAGAGAELVVVRGVPHPLVSRYMSACDVLLVTSRHEGAGTMAKEALACNLPVVSVDVGDIGELIGHLDGCVLCADDRPATIARALETVLSRTDAFEGRDTARAYEDRVLAAHVKGVYEHVLAGTSKGPAEAGPRV